MKKLAPSQRGTLGGVEIALIVVLLVAGGYVALRMVSANDAKTVKPSTTGDAPKTPSQAGSISPSDSAAVTATDSQSKTEINAIHLRLEEYEANNGYYPRADQLDKLKGLAADAELSDANGKLINTKGSAYTYKPTGCNSMGCTEYVLATTTSTGPYEKHSLSE